MGEYRTLLLWMNNGLDDQETAHAAEGWGGDRYAVYSERDGDGVVLEWQTVWDTRTDAVEFTNALVKQQSAVNNDIIGSQPVYRKGWIKLDGTDASVRIRRSGKHVTMIVVRGDTSALADHLASQIAPSSSSR